MDKIPGYLFGIIIVLGGIAAGYYFWLQNQAEEPSPPPRAESQPSPEPKAEPAIRHPVREAESGAPAQALPALDASDAAVDEALAGLFGRRRVQEFFHLQGMVRRIVATVDNLPREKLALRLLPVKPATGPFLVTGTEQGRVIAAANYARYEPFIRLAAGVDVRRLVSAYVRFYPLFQQAYRELGYPSGYFNDRLVEVIDHLLATPDVAGPVRLVQPRVVYQFEDPELEARSAGQKILIRIGPANAGQIKAKLREIRKELTGQQVPL